MPGGIPNAHRVDTVTSAYPTPRADHAHSTAVHRLRPIRAAWPNCTSGPSRNGPAKAATYSRPTMNPGYIGGGLGIARTPRTAAADRANAATISAPSRIVNGTRPGLLDGADPFIDTLP